MNQVTLFGNLGSDPELRRTEKSCVLNMRIATNERIKRGDEWQDHTEWHNVTIWGKRAEALAGMITKGTKLLVRGSLRTRSFEHNGQKRYSTEISADDIVIAGGGRERGSNPGAPARAKERPEDFNPENYGDDSGSVFDRYRQ